MPSYKTHFIHGEMIYSMIQPKLHIDKELFQLFCMGPDAMILTDYKTFDYQHSHKTKIFFTSMIKRIKKKNLQYNPEVMAFLYGQIDHFVLDTVMHPFIFYVTEKYPNHNKIPTHGLVEMWIDDYVSNEYKGETDPFSSPFSCNSPELKDLINSIYQKVYGTKNSFFKYDIGYRLTRLFDLLIRRDSSKVLSRLMNKYLIGDITYHRSYDQAKPFLNLNKKVWYDPETNEEKSDSFDDLWLKSLELSQKLIHDVDNYLYHNKEL